MNGDIFDQMEAKAKRRHGDLGDTTAAARAMSQQPEKPGALRRAGSSLKQVGADINAELPVIGGTLGAALGAETGPGALGTAALGAAGGRALQQALNPVFGAEAPADPMQAYGQQAMSAFTAGAGPGAAEVGLQAALPHAANALGRISIGQGWGDLPQLSDTMLRYGLRNTRGGYERIKALVKGISEAHKRGLEDTARNDKPTWLAVQDYLMPVVARLRRGLLNTNFGDEAEAELDRLAAQFAKRHKIYVGAERWRDRTIGPVQINAMKEDADMLLREIRYRRPRLQTEVTPEMTMRQQLLEGLGNQARTMMYGMAEADGIRRGGPLAHLAALDKEQHLLLNLKETIGPEARKNMDQMAKMGEVGLRVSPFAAGAALIPHSVPEKMMFGMGGAAAGAAITHPAVVGDLARLVSAIDQTGVVPPAVAALIRYASQVYDVSHAPKQP